MQRRIRRIQFGAIDQTGDIQGTILIDDFAVDEDRLWMDPSAQNGALSGEDMLFVKSGFAFVGEGMVEQVSVIDTGSNNARIKIWDADVPSLLPVGALRENLVVTGANRTEQSKGRRGFRCRRGCYVELSGTNPQALIRLGAVASDRPAQAA